MEILKDVLLHIFVYIFWGGIFIGLLVWIVSAFIWAIKSDEDPIEWMDDPALPRKKEPGMKSKSATNIYININSKNKSK